jgi:hypothetical protein
MFINSRWERLCLLFCTKSNLESTHSLAILIFLFLQPLSSQDYNIYLTTDRVRNKIIFSKIRPILKEKLGHKFKTKMSLFVSNPHSKIYVFSGPIT